MPRVYKQLKLGSFDSLGDGEKKSFMFCGKLLTRVDEADGTFSLRLTQTHYVEKLEKVVYQHILETRNYNAKLAARSSRAPKQKCAYRA